MVSENRHISNWLISFKQSQLRFWYYHTRALFLTSYACASAYLLDTIFRIITDVHLTCRMLSFLCGSRLGQLTWCTRHPMKICKQTLGMLLKMLGYFFQLYHAQAAFPDLGTLFTVKVRIIESLFDACALAVWKDSLSEAIGCTLLTFIKHIRRWVGNRGGLWSSMVHWPRMDSWDPQSFLGFTYTPFYIIYLKFSGKCPLGFSSSKQQQQQLWKQQQ